MWVVPKYRIWISKYSKSVFPEMQVAIFNALKPHFLFVSPEYMASVLVTFLLLC